MTDLPEPRKAQSGAQGLWLSLLVLDSVFVIVFGGAVAAKVYQSWKTPAVAAAAAHHRPAPKAAQAAKAAEAAPMPPAPTPAPSAPAPRAPEARISRRADEPRPPKPSLLNEPPKPRSTPGLATSGAAAPAPAAPAAASSAAAPTKARPVVFKLRANAGAVQLVGAFIVHGGRKDMAKAADGSWSLKLYLNPGQYRYFFNVDNKKTLDPKNPASDRGASLLTVPVNAQ